MSTPSASNSPSPAAPTGPASELRDRLDAKTATIAVVGLGYVGLPLVRAAHDAGFPVIGFDTDARKVDMLKRGENYLQHLGNELVEQLTASGRFRPTSSAQDLAEADAILLCVPTPLGPHREPDLSFVLDSTRMITPWLRKGQLVVLESTTYPGTTREEMLPILAETGLRCGEDFFLAYSPEREDPGRAGTTTSSIPKLVGGVDGTSTDLAMALYTAVVDEAHRVSSAEVAEAAKLLENIYRAVNIALVNEAKTILADMGIDVWEVIAAASTKPFGFQPFYPGPGLGGHCIPIDPFYLTWKAKAIGHGTKFIELAGEINAEMPAYVVSRLVSALNDRGQALKGSAVLVIGIAYKPNIDDIRESPAAHIIERLWAGGATVSYHDPHVPVFPPMREHRIDLASIPLTEQALKEHDCVVIVTDHDAIDYELVARHAGLIVDTRNAMARVANPVATIVKA
jgi:UDP-N-acetyl-D-glucosamine dehydrogenase